MKLNYIEAVEGLIPQAVLKKIKNNQVLIFGGGDSGSWAYKLLQRYNIKIVGFIDNSPRKQGLQKFGLIIYSFDEAVNLFPEAHIAIASMWKEEIIGQIGNKNSELLKKTYDVLTSMAWETSSKNYISKEIKYIKENENQFNNIYSILNDKCSKETLEGILNYRLTRKENYLKKIKNNNDIYFDKSLINSELLKKGIIVDAGAFDGDTIICLNKMLNSETLRIHAYETEKANCSKLKENILPLRNIDLTIHQCALWSESGIQLNFSGDGLSGKIESNGKSILVQTEKIDDLLNKKIPISFIKMDIEGAEREALIGAEKIIVRDKPILAICAYHLQDDLIEIPKLILRINPKYKLYLRHYMLSAGDTVLYAI